MKTILLYILALLSYFSCFADEVPGYYIDLLGDTSFVTFRIPGWGFNNAPDYSDLHFGIRYYDEITCEKKFLSPKETSEVNYIYRATKVRLLSIPNVLKLPSPPNLSGVKVFLKLEIDGKLKLFTFYFYNNFSKNLSITHILVKNVLEQYRIGMCSKFKADMNEYLNDCPELVNKINNKTLKCRHFKQIVTEYNQTCGF